MTSTFHTFISSSPFKTPPGTLVTILGGLQVKEERVPAGFQVLEFVTALYGGMFDTAFSMGHNPHRATVDVRDDAGEVFASFDLVYDEVSGERS